MYVVRRLSHLKHRLAVGVALALCLGHLQVAQASKLPDFSRSGVNYTGKSASVGMTGSGTSFGSTVPVSPPVGGGWQYAGNYGIPASATGPTMTMSANGNVFFAGTKYPFQAGYQVPSSAVTDALKGMAGLFGGPLGLGLTIAGGAMPFVLDWLQRSGGRIKEDGSIERQNSTVCTVSPCYEYSNGVAGDPGPSTWHSTKLASCQAAATRQQANTSYYVIAQNPRLAFAYGQDVCRVDFYYRSNGQYDSYQDYTFSEQSAPPQPANWLPSSMDDIAPYMDPTTRDPRVIQEILNKGGDIALPAPTVTGPSSIEGPTKETANPDGSKTVEKTTYNFNTSGDTINNTTNNTTTTIYNTDNSVRSTTDTTNTPEEQPDPLDCQKDSSTIGCSKLDTPEEDLPKADKNITYTAESWFGGGSCPADKIVTVGGQQVKAWDWTVSCDYLVTYGRPLILAAAAFMALMILAPGVKE